MNLSKLAVTAIIGLMNLLGAAVASADSVSIRMNDVVSLQDYYELRDGARPHYEETDPTDLQDSIGRCILAYLHFKMKNLDTVILYAGRDVNDRTHLLCSIYPAPQFAYESMCAAIGMEFGRLDEAEATLHCSTPS